MKPQTQNNVPSKVISVYLFSTITTTTKETQKELLQQQKPRYIPPNSLSIQRVSK